MMAEKMKELNDQELNQKLKDLKTELFNLRFQLATGQLGNIMTIRELKRDIARVKTVIRQREIKAAAE